MNDRDKSADWLILLGIIIIFAVMLMGCAHKHDICLDVRGLELDEYVVQELLNDSQ